MFSRWFRRACYALPVAIVGGTSVSYLLGERKRLSILKNANPSSLSVFNPAKSNDDAVRRRAVVIGAGVVGVSTAYALAKRGVEVVVIDSSSESAANCSLVASGAMQKWNAVIDSDTFINVAKSFFLTSKCKAFFHVEWFQVMTDPHFIRWFLGFTYNSFRYSDDDNNSVKMLNSNMLTFTAWAIDYTIGIMKDLNITERCGFNDNGALKVQPKGSGKALVYAAKMSLEKSVPVNIDEIIELEPCLEPIRSNIESAQFQTGQTGDSQHFTIALTEECQRLGVKFLFDTRVSALRVQKDKVTGVLTDKGQIPLQGSDNLVVAAGSWTPQLLWWAGLYTPVYPLKGYSLIMDLPRESLDESKLPQRIISNTILYITRLGNRVRMGSMGEFAGWNTTPNPTVEKAFRELALASQPYLAGRIANTKVRCGLRPYVNDGIIMIGRLPTLSNALVNIGPGFTGWQLCGGSGEAIAKLIVDDHDDLMDTISALTPKGRVAKAPIWSKLCMSRWF